MYASHVSILDWLIHRWDVRVWCGDTKTLDPITLAAHNVAIFISKRQSRCFILHADLIARHLISTIYLF